jgi:hypothetical protein
MAIKKEFIPIIRQCKWCNEDFKIESNLQCRKVFCIPRHQQLYTYSIIKIKNTELKKNKNTAKIKKQKVQKINKKIKNKNTTNQLKTEDLLKYFSSRISDYSTNKKRIKIRLRLLLPHIRLNNKYVDICKEKIEKLGGSITMLSFETFVNTHCSFARLVGLDNQKF